MLPETTTTGSKSSKLLCFASLELVPALRRGENHAVVLIHNHFNPQYSGFSLQSALCTITMTVWPHDADLIIPRSRLSRPLRRLVSLSRGCEAFLDCWEWKLFGVWILRKHEGDASSDGGSSTPHERPLSSPYTPLHAFVKTEFPAKWIVVEALGAIYLGRRYWFVKKI